VWFWIVGRIRHVEAIASGGAVRELPRLRKLKGIVTVELSDGTRALAEVHWYEAYGVGQREMKIKRFLD